jgi:hypothetical protein
MRILWMHLVFHVSGNEMKLTVFTNIKPGVTSIVERIGYRIYLKNIPVKLSAGL